MKVLAVVAQAAEVRGVGLHLRPTTLVETELRSLDVRNGEADHDASLPAQPFYVWPLRCRWPPPKATVQDGADACVGEAHGRSRAS